MRFVKESRIETSTRPDSEEKDEKPGSKTPTPAQKMSMTAKLSKSRNTIDYSATEIHAPTLKPSKNRTMSNFRPGRNQMKTLNPFSTAKKSLMENKLEALTYKNTLDYSTIFQREQVDVHKFVIPIAGYGGHRRGDRSQNFFGKAFRETSLQAKKLKEDFRSPRTFNKEH